MPKANHQHTSQLVLKDGASRGLQRVKIETVEGADYDENWLQELLFQHTNLLPVSEIEPVFGPLIPVCREISTNEGPLDLLYISPQGFLTLVECKIWRNPEARREVVGQILD